MAAQDNQLNSVEFLQRLARENPEKLTQFASQLGRPKSSGVFSQTPQQFGALPSNPAPPSNLFSTATTPQFPSNFGEIPQPSLDKAKAPDYIGGAALATGKVPIQTKYGTIYANALPQKEGMKSQAEMFASRPTSFTGRSFAEQENLLEKARAGGAAIGSKLAEDQRNKYYAFRQSLAEKKAQEAMSTERGRSPQMAIGAQSLLEAERFKQAQSGRNPMATTPLSAYGMQFQRGGMGQFSPIKNVGNQFGSVIAGSGQFRPTAAAAMAPQPNAGFGSYGFPSATGSIASGSLPSFSYGSYTPNFGQPINRPAIPSGQQIDKGWYGLSSYGAGSLASQF